MSIVFGGIRQLGMVVRDADKAMEEWGKLGVGPWFTMRNFIVDDFIYRGKTSPAPELTLCFACSGALQIELIQQHNDVPSAYQDFLAQGKEGAQHVAAWFSDHDSYDAKRAQLMARGFELIHEGAARENDSRFAYFETGEPGGLMFEIAEATLPNLEEFQQTIVQAAIDWDGRQLIAL
ncbi:VOC family protein [Kineobactrum salinum]|uniref:VOC family protein n=1 Tax=Kineobactrum salinum TaxID=2708301 RepID=A0A6C0U4H9_9GAMM|nr:VOC family protein [Kineobactrum salinum]QIB66838.1 VOC family protein [Kineobactrum salinum]